MPEPKTDTSGSDSKQPNTPAARIDLALTLFGDYIAADLYMSRNHKEALHRRDVMNDARVALEVMETEIASLTARHDRMRAALTA